MKELKKKGSQYYRSLTSNNIGAVLGLLKEIESLDDPSAVNSTKRNCIPLSVLLEISSNKREVSLGDRSHIQNCKLCRTILERFMIEEKKEIPLPADNDALLSKKRKTKPNLKKKEVCKQDIEELLQAFPSGDKLSIDKLFTIIYHELKSMAHDALRNEKNTGTLNATELVHEAYIYLVKNDVSYKDKCHFFTIAGNAMRRILVEEARRRNAKKRGSGQLPVSFEQLGDMELEKTPGTSSYETIETIDTFLNELEKYNKRLCKIVELRYFVGLNVIEIAEILGLSRTAVSNDWKWAKLLLFSFDRQKKNVSNGA